MTTSENDYLPTLGMSSRLDGYLVELKSCLRVATNLLQLIEDRVGTEIRCIHEFYKEE
ncbi:hypothetical protein LCGC14_1996150 [marine sediment metagenome]|uniref:Uncharacterized protein n=1 Tax=marine sediment metagenome TaxID=412755 RepID=A0A0F9HI29_9ZZZZ